MIHFNLLIYITLNFNAIALVLQHHSYDEYSMCYICAQFNTIIAKISTMPAKKYKVILTEEERIELVKLTSKGKIGVRKLIHAQILLLSDESGEKISLKDADIAKAQNISRLTVERVRKRFVDEGIDSALNPKVQIRRVAKKLDGKGEAFLVATACSQAPEGHSDWTLKLLADRLVECDIVDSISTECVRQTLKKTN